MTRNPIEKGDIVLVNGPPGEVIGEVLHASTLDELPDLGPGSASKEALDVMREMRVDLVLLIAHKHEGRDACFFAVHNQDGRVRVVKGYRGGAG